MAVLGVLGSGELAVLTLITFHIKHFFGDSVVQSSLLPKNVTWAALLPFSWHCLLHALLTLGICLMLKPSLWWLCGVDFALHLFFDRIRTAPSSLGRFRYSSKFSVWMMMGMDQVCHHLIYIIITASLIF